MKQLDIDSLDKYLKDCFSNKVVQINPKILDGTNEKALYEEKIQQINELNETKNIDLILLNKELQTRVKILESKVKEQEERLEEKKRRAAKRRAKETKRTKNDYKKEKQLELEYYKKQIEIKRNYCGTGARPNYNYLKRQAELESSYLIKEEQLEHRYKEKEKELEKREIDLQQEIKHHAENSSLNTCHCKATTITSDETANCSQANNNDYEEIITILRSYIAEYEIAIEAIVKYCDISLKEFSDYGQLNYKFLYYDVKRYAYRIKSRLNDTKDEIRNNMLSSRRINDLNIA
ncbi:hypothetical protein BDF19DRAFT_410069 [Syncephalis fuscata]|nr:hypothetical protein BDF19DRAFT_410069 [Syncephalis fuscata]